eukprot:TRINITY_DN3994_c0_g2_i1.p1 TRINITY_DN3994_c0_g2~~TRINITY_DN3994_c0_g2_i1.p1  ORF type:complete len:1890 (+),score=461.48 TRINITY_DN3994_c0_g2_i1:76-5670(+)
MRGAVVLLGVCIGGARGDASTPCGTVINGNFDTSFFASDLASVNLLQDLNGPGPFTIFAPSDAAFSALPSGHKGMLSPGSETLRLSLLHHIHTGSALFADQLSAMSGIQMNSGAELRVDNSSDSLRVGPVTDTAGPVLIDIPCSGGIVHVIDRVLADAPNATLPSRNLLETLQALSGNGANQKYSRFLGSSDVQSILEVNKGPVTVLVPPDSSFSAISATLQDSARMKEILLGHNLEGMYLLAAFSAKGSAPTFDGGNPLLWEGDNRVRSSSVLSGDTFATNGVVHFLSSVLFDAADTSSTVPTVCTATPRLASFGRALSSSGAERMLRGAGPMTVFAPSTAAFNSLPTGVAGWLNSRPSLFAQVLFYHVISGVRAAPEFIGQNMRTVLSATHQLGALSDETSNVWRVQAADPQIANLVVNGTTQASNGVVHAIDRLFVPPEVTLPSANLEAVLSGRPDLTRFHSWVRKVKTTRGISVAQAPGPHTLLAFSNAAYEKLTQDERDILDTQGNGKLKDKVAAYHVIGEYLSAEALAARVGAVNTLDEKTTGGFWPVYTGSEAGATVVSPQSTLSTKGVLSEPDIGATNGVIHVLDTLLLPPDVDSSVHSGWGWEKCAAVGNSTATGKDRCQYQFQCYAHHTASQLQDQAGDEQGSAKEVAFIVVCVLLGCWLRHQHQGVLSAVPYELTMFLFAVAFGGIASLGKPLSDYDGLSALQPNIIFFVFLPPLIFHAAFTCDTHLFKRLSKEFLIVAGPGVLLASFLTAVLAKSVFTTYNWRFYTCFVYGALISATDPVSVVTNARNLVAAPVLSTMMIGESLFSSGVSIALVELTKDSIPTGEPDGGWHILFLKILQKLLGGPVVGLVVAVFLTRSLKEVFNDPIIEVTATFVATYVAFFVSEGFLQVSGTLAVVTLGCYLSYKETCISPEVLSTMRSFWETIVFVTTTLVFALTGLIVVQNAFSHVKGSDFGNVIIAYIGLNIIRGIVFLLLAPVLKKFAGNRFSPATLFLFTWTGLRGAVVLCLALIVKGDDGIHCYDKYLGDRFLFHAAGVVILTLCVNSTLAVSVVQHFGLNEVGLAAKRNMRHCFAEMKSAMEDELLQLKLDFVLSDANWNRVKQITHGEMEDPYNRGKEKVTLASQMELLERGVYFSLFDAANMRQFRDGLLLGSAHRVLHRWRCSVIDQEAASRERMRPLIGSERLQKLWVVPRWKQRLCKCRLENMQIRRFGFSFNVLLGFIHAHDYIIQNVDRLTTDTVASSRVKDHCRKVRAEATVLMTDATTDHADVSIAMRTKAAARSVLNAGRVEIQEQLRNTQIEPRDALVLRRMVERQMKKIPKLPRSLPRSGNDETLSEWVEWYRADPQCKYQLSRVFRYHVFERDSRIFKKENQDERRGFYVVLKGVVRVHHRGSAQVCGQGYSIGLLSSLTDSPGQFTDAWAESFLHVARFPAAEVRHCTRIYPQMKDAIWLQAGRSAAFHCMAALNPWLSWERRNFDRLIRNGRILEVLRSHPTRLKPGSFYVLFSGKATPLADEKEQLAAVSLIPERFFNGLSFSSNAMVLAIPDPSSSQAKARRRWQKLHERLRFIRSMTWLQGWQGFRVGLRRFFGDQEQIEEDDGDDHFSNKFGSFVSPKHKARRVGSGSGGGNPLAVTKELSAPLLPEPDGEDSEPDPEDFGGSWTAYSPPVQPERRRDPADGGLYTKREFQTCYGGTEEWEAASPKGSLRQQSNGNGASKASQQAERRKDDDGRWYTLQEFVHEYGGSASTPPQQWHNASPAALLSPAPPTTRRPHDTLRSRADSLRSPIGAVPPQRTRALPSTTLLRHDSAGRARHFSSPTREPIGAHRAASAGSSRSARSGRGVPTLASRLTV